MTQCGSKHYRNIKRLCGPRGTSLLVQPTGDLFPPKVTYYKQQLVGVVLGQLWQAVALEPRVVGLYEEFVDATRLRLRRCSQNSGV